MENAFLRIKETGTIKWKYSVLLFALLLGLFSCTSYKTQYVGFRPAADYPNNVAADGLTIGVGGAVYGGAKEGTDPKQSRTIDDDLWDKGLEGKKTGPEPGQRIPVFPCRSPECPRIEITDGRNPVRKCIHQ